MRRVRVVPTWRAGLVAALAMIGIVACTTAEPVGESAPAARVGSSVPVTDTGDGSPANRDSAAMATREPWYDRARAIDLTGDGIADSVRLTARGERADSMQIRLVFIVGGEQKHREEWGSSYELEFRDTAALGSAQVEALLRARLDTVLASVAVEPLEGKNPGLMAEDSVILKDISPWPTTRVVFSYGFESQPNLFWDAPRQRFVQLWSCC